MNTKILLLALFFPFTMPAMEATLSEADMELQSCKAMCEQKFIKEKPFWLDHQDDIYKSNIAFQNKKLCFLECFEKYRAFITLASSSKAPNQDK